MNANRPPHTLIPLSKPSVGSEELGRIADVLAGGYLGCGPMVDAFEECVKHLLGAEFFIATATGTAALHLSLEALELPPGSGVLVPSLTFASGIQAILMAGLRPVFCEVDDDLILDIEDAERRLAPDVKAVMPVHYGGRVCDVSMLREQMGLRVVEDGAHAFGSWHNGKRLGSRGQAVCFSFDPVKTVTCGDGGGIATDDRDFAERVRLLRSSGIANPKQGSVRGGHSVIGFGYRYHMNDIAASIGLAQMQRFESMCRRRQQICKQYVERLQPLAGIRIAAADYDEIVPYNFTILVLSGMRSALRRWLDARRIVTGIHYMPNHLQPAFKQFYSPLPVTEQIGDQIISLPLHADMTDDAVETVAASIWEFFDSHAH